MKQFLAFVKKEFYHIFRDRWTMIILLVLPIMMLILFGFMITTEVKNTKFAIYDPSHDVATQGIVNKLSTSDYFIFKGYLDSPEQIDGVFRKGDIGLVVVFGERFYENMLHTGDAQIQLIADGSDPNTASTLTMYATSLIASYQQDMQGSMKIPYQIKPEIKLLYNPTLKGAYNFVPGVMGMILMLVCAMMTSVSIAREKEYGHHGSAAGFAHAPFPHHLFKDDSVFLYLACEPCHYSIVGPLHAWRSHSGKFRTGDPYFAYLHFCIAGFGAFYLDCCRKTNCGTAYFGCRFDAASGVPFRDDVPTRKHANSFTVVCQHYPGQVVHNCHAKRDDQRLGYFVGFARDHHSCLYGKPDCFCQYQTF